jgi:hypothetical protein
MRSFRRALVFLSLSCRHREIAMAIEEQQQVLQEGVAAGKRALPSRDPHHRRVVTNEAVDVRCQIPINTDKTPTECVQNQNDFLEQLSDNSTDLILICQGATIVLKEERFSEIITTKFNSSYSQGKSFPIKSNKTVICQGIKSDCIIDGQDLWGVNRPAFEMELGADFPCCQLLWHSLYKF